MEVLVIELIKDAIQQLEEANIADATVDSWLLSEEILNVKKENYYMNMGITVNKELAAKYKEAVNKRAEHIPLQHIIGYQQFLDYKILVNENVLIPRPETELLVEKVTNFIGNSEMKVLDMCTGSGCIAIAVDRMCDNASVIGADISKDALKVATKNNALNHANVEFTKSDMFADIDGKYDVIVSNPPYIPTKDVMELEQEVKEHDPLLALDGSDDGLKFYRIISENAVEYLREKGMLFLEIGYDQGKTVPELLKNSGFTNIKVFKDLSGLDRMVVAGKE